MDVLMIHGIGQEASTKDELLKKWMESIHAVQPDLFGGTSVEMAYYGTTLSDWANGKAKNVVGMGGESTAVDVGDLDELKFISAVMEEFACDCGIDEAEIEAAMSTVRDNVVPMDNFIARRLVGLLRVIEKISPAKGSLLLRIIKQGHTYLSSPGAAKAVDDIVRPLLQRSPQVLITHSLGTVIAFKLLREMEAEGHADVQIPLLITMGSPLGLEAFKSKLGAPRRKPAFVDRWENFYDRSDFVALGKPLDEKNFARNIYNDGFVDNNTFTAHGIIGYLPHQGVVDALKRVLK
ncbi:hypothetical protein [Serratia fonticola]|uniref:hypothetical protein n=1 Tax=Serratia fonticola TaxID=47917 RepID=UPI0021ADD1E5|nr:hypothetical protein [Serratia fonticola]